MNIKILPPQLANQIAAGEVVERPASVVKELVENSLDAGATKIQIDIDHGGASLIRIRDNGIGIAKADLSLALARHATSKISSIEDLEAILSLGFRGEALASISSVSRLTLTSRPQDQAQAWQVYAQGRDMETTIQPASHPVGTTVEVANLFFNTPARRKFLRTDKTEFSHIDEVIRRIALAKPSVAFTLTHNNKIIRQYKSAVDNLQKMKRVAAICGEDFMQHALQIDWKHDHLHLSGWIALPSYTRLQNDLAYSYVNGRMVRDKVINHAIKQAYAEELHSEQHPAFVLFIDLDPNDVDVNVHPTKHEVRFHQSRLIHDFIWQGIYNALHSAPVQTDTTAPQKTVSETPTTHFQVSEPQGQWSVAAKPNRAAAGKNIFASNAGNTVATTSSDFTPRFTKKAPRVAQKAYAELMSTEKITTLPTTTSPAVSDNQTIADTTTIASHAVLHSLALVENKALLLQQQQRFYLLPLEKLQRLKHQLMLQQETQSPLLIPVMFRLTAAQQQRWQQQKDFFQQAQFEFSENLAQHRISLNKVPSCLRQHNLQKIVMSLLAQDCHDFSLFLTALCQQFPAETIQVFADAVSLLNETERRLGTQKASLNALLIPINWQPYLEQL
ncbi:MAG: DNA mismatch repair endonuclease MutL [[Pasteurella] mairii]|uniref:DNA mismatch repair protein MutL n=1 Tax=[Pasteurella] mairii TaxID=757 RepID=A0A379B595_9PAST|nr:DNA mismatch repair endonuclease MutL [[Pasteurella] mairii]SUB33716.1 DNA mismatch repair protein [[Pasteurella] mairii]